MKNPFEKLPPYFNKDYTEICSGCGKHEISETITYEINIDMKYQDNLYGDTNKQNFKIYYTPKYYHYFRKGPKIIGEKTGTGRPLEEEIDFIYKILVDMKKV